MVCPLSTSMTPSVCDGLLMPASSDVSSKPKPFSGLDGKGLGASVTAVQRRQNCPRTLSWPLWTPVTSSLYNPGTGSRVISDTMPLPAFNLCEREVSVANTSVVHNALARFHSGEREEVSVANTSLVCHAHGGVSLNGVTGCWLVGMVWCC